MVSAALLVLTVSTLAVHGKVVSTDDPIIPAGCEGKRLCHIKPDDYPQEEIDDFFVKNPEYLKRLKREVANNKNEKEDLELEEGNIDGNCKTNIEDSKPYLVKYNEIENENDRSKLPQIIVQSSFFDQTIRQVTCEEAPNTNKTIYQCFRALVKGSFDGSACIQVTRKHKLVVYDRVNKKMEEIPDVLNIDCVCATL